MREGKARALGTAREELVSRRNVYNWSGDLAGEIGAVTTMCYLFMHTSYLQGSLQGRVFKTGLLGPPAWNTDSDLSTYYVPAW